MKKHTNKWLSMLLILMMVFAMLPTTAFASVQRRYVTLRPTTALGGSHGSVKVSVGDTVTSYNGNESYTVRSVRGTEITVWVYLDNNGQFFFPKAEDLWNDVSPVDYVYWSGNSSGQKTENGSGLTSNGAADSNCGLATYYLKSGSSGQSNLWNFTLQYNANGGTGAPAAQTYSTNDKYTKSHTFTISMQTPIREGYTFLGWADSSTAAEATRQPGGTCLVSQTVSGYNGGSVTKILYAVWNENTPPADKYTVTYTDGVNGEEIFKDQVYSDLLSGTATPAFSGTPAREGYVFKGWSPEVAATVTANATYTATWGEDKNGNGKDDATEEKFTVTYTDGVNGEEIFKDQVYSDLLSGTATPAFSGTPAREGYVFKGWSPEVAATVTANATYTATWGEDKNSDSPQTGDYTNLSLWIALLVLSAVGLMGSIVYSRKRRQN